jgi:hypothetical protein
MCLFAGVCAGALQEACDLRLLLARPLRGMLAAYTGNVPSLSLSSIHICSGFKRSLPSEDCLGHYNVLGGEAVTLNAY